MAQLMEMELLQREAELIANVELAIDKLRLVKAAGDERAIQFWEDNLTMSVAAWVDWRRANGRD